jgi:hypothetical protein
MLTIMFVFFVANLPLPIIFYLNVVVTLRYLKVRHLARTTSANIAKPRQLVLGWWLGNLSMLFAFAPAVYERTLFVQNHTWLISYAIAASLSITGLLLMNDGLGEELRLLARRKRPRKPVDTSPSDTL